MEQNSAQSQPIDTSAGIPDVTIIVPTYNTGKFLDQCLSSIEANDKAQLEIIVINDGSTDNSLEIMRAHEAKDHRIRVIDKPNGGYGSGCNRGLNEARGTYIAIVEPDDYLLPHFYDTMMSYACTFDELPDIVKTPYIRVTMPTTPQERLYHCAYYCRGIPENKVFTLKDYPRLFQHHPSIWSAMYRRQFIEDHHIRFMEAKGGGWVDNPFLAETLCQAQSIVYLDKEFYCYREDLPGSSSMLKSTDLAFTRWNDMTDVLDRLDVTDPGIRKAHAVRGIAYLSGIMEEANIAGSAAEQKMRDMFERIDPSDILENYNISNDIKRLYCSVRGIDPTFKKGLYRKALFDEFFFSWHNNGFAFAMSRFALFFRRRAKINAHNPTITHSAGI